MSAAQTRRLNVEASVIGASTMALSAAKWVATSAGVSRAMVFALNRGIVGCGFVLFLVSSVLWTTVGVVQREPRGGSLNADAASLASWAPPTPTTRILGLLCGQVVVLVQPATGI
jgi:hypothetical protein